MVVKKEMVTYLVAFVLLGMSFSFLYFFGTNMTGFAVYEQESQSDFDEGTYNNTEWNGSAIVISSGMQGNYTSKIFDASADATWNNLTKTQATPNVESLFAVDGSGDVYQSTDLGVNWVLSQEDFGRTTATKEMFSNSEYLYILSSNGNEVWSSSDGTDFAVVYNDFDGRSPLVGDNYNNDLYVVVGHGKVWKSSDNGVTWVYKGDFNGGSDNGPRGLAVDSSGYIYVVGSAGNVFKSINDGVDWEKVKDGYGGSTGTDGMDEDSLDNLYILLNTEIYKSIDEGVTWNVINDSISPYANTLVEILIDSNDNFFILDAIGRTFKSIDYGISWSEFGDMNGGASNDPKGITDFIQSTNLTYQVRNCSQADCSDGAWQDVDLNNINLQSRYFQYKVSFESPDASITPSLESTIVNYDIINSAPTIALINPQGGATYGYNESLALDFSVSDAEDNIDSCWYNLNAGENITVPNCQNTTFNVSGDGNYVLNIYANDSLGLESSDSASFSVAVGAPTIVLHFPIDEYLNYQENIQFNYTPTDVDLDNCELWGDFDGEFRLNQTDMSVVSGQINNFNLNLEDGTYLWNIKCNDTQGNSAFNGNKTFYVDTINPSLSLIEPTGSKSSKTGIPLLFNVSDTNLENCWYNLTRWDGENWIGYRENTGINCSENSMTFGVADDYEYQIYLTANDSAGNINIANSSFSVDTSSSPLPSNGGSGSSGGGGSGGGSAQQTAKLTISKLSGVIADAGEGKMISLKIKNDGLKFLNKCKLTTNKEFSSWIYSTVMEDIGPGQTKDFIFDLNMPEFIDSGEYVIPLIVQCEEINKTANLSITILEKKINFEIIKFEREGKDKLRARYYLEELSGVEQNVELQFLLFDEANEKVAEMGETNTISPNSKEEFETIIPIDVYLRGNLKLLVNINSEIYSTTIEDELILGPSTTGLAIFGESGNSENLIIFFMLLGCGAFAFFMIRRIWRLKKKVKEKKGYKKIKVKT